jgi:hypothetical protein
MRDDMDVVLGDEQLMGIGVVSPDWKERGLVRVNIKLLKTALDIFSKMERGEIELAISNDNALLVGEKKPNGKFVGLVIAQVAK